MNPLSFFSETGHLNALKLQTHAGKAFFNTDQIMRIEGLSNYSKLHFADGKTLIVSKVLHWFEDHLPADKFTRVHKSHLINTAYIYGYRPGCTQSILLKDKSCIQVARRKQAVVRKFMQLKISA